MNPKLFKYIDNQLSNEQRTEFERELDSNIELRAEYETYSRIQNELNSLKDIALDETYINDSIFRMREKLDQKKSIRKSKALYYSFATVFSVIILFLLYNSYFVNKKVQNRFNNKIEEVVKNMPMQELEAFEDVVSQPEYQSNSNENIVDAVDSEDSEEINNALDKELASKLNNSGLSILLENNTSLDELAANLDDNEIQMVYDEIKDKNLLAR